jgi:hypothetical protein
VLDKSNETGKHSGATYLVNKGVPVWIDSKHAIAHNKVMIIDGANVITGSFNFTKAAEKSNAENLVIIAGRPTGRAGVRRELRGTPRTLGTLQGGRRMSKSDRKSGRRKIIRVGLSRDGVRRYQGAVEASGMTHVAVHSRLVEFLARAPTRAARISWSCQYKDISAACSSGSPESNPSSRAARRLLPSCALRRRPLPILTEGGHK